MFLALTPQSHVKFQCLFISRSLEIFGEDVSYEEDFQEMVHAQGFLLDGG